MKATKPLASLLVLSTLTSASAGSTFFADLLSFPGMTFKDHAENVFLYSITPAGSTPLNLNVNLFTWQKQGRLVTRVDFFMNREFFNGADQKVVNNVIWNFAKTCMNLRPERQAPLLNWLAAMNKKATVNALTKFGPMSIHYKRYIGSDGQYVTDIGVGRDGRPGVSPWLNFCYTD